MEGIRGCILAPFETKEDFLKRRRVWEEISETKQKGLSLPLYDLYDIEALIVYSRKSLLPWQGAVLWECFTETGETYPSIQLRKNLAHRCLGRCSEEEVLSHELVHAVRFAFKEPLFEEMFAYKTSKSAMRRFFGPLFLWPFESALFAIVSGLAPFFSFFIEPFWTVCLLTGIFSFFFLRLLLLHLIFSLCASKLKKVGIPSKDSLAVMIRLSDLEILKTAFSSPKKVLRYFQEGLEKEERLQMIHHSYFQRV